MKRSLTIGLAMLLVLGGCVSTSVMADQATAESKDTTIQSVSTKVGTSSVASLGEHKKAQTFMEKEIVRKSKLNSNSIKIKKMVKNLKKQVGKTWYVFSGSTPRGWDCSGMTLWAYNKVGIQLEHSASKQLHAGKVTKTPKFGDIVAFSYKGSKGAYHVGIYLGKDKMLHSGGKSGQVTSVASIKSWGGSYSKITYVRFIESESFAEQNARQVKEQQQGFLFASSS